MTQDEIIDTAIQAWADAGEGWVVKEWFDDRAKAFVAFAKLVAAKEREACAKMCETKHFSSPVRAFGAKECAAAIRARGEQA